MDDLISRYESHAREVEEYVALLGRLEAECRGGPPKIMGVAIPPEQVYDLYSGAFMQIYNLVEGTVSQCWSALCGAIAIHKCVVSDLRDEIRREWIRESIKPAASMNPEKRIGKVKILVDFAAKGEKFMKFEIGLGGGGNWSDETIENFLRRIGCGFNLDRNLRALVRRPYKDGDGVMKFLVVMRNKLAHGNITFRQCGQDVEFSTVDHVFNAVNSYLRKMVEAISTYISKKEFLSPRRLAAINGG